MNMPRGVALLIAIFAVVAGLAPFPAAAQVTLFQEPDFTKAAKTGDAGKIRDMLGRNVNVNRQDSSGRSALIHSAIGGYSDIAKMLLEAGAKPDVADKLGNSPLVWAARRGDYRIARMLVEAGADLDFQNRQGQTPLMAAAAQSRLRLVEYLIEAGADLDILDYTGRGALGWARAAGRDRRVERALEDAGARD